MRTSLLSTFGLLALAGLAGAQNVDERRGYVTLGLYYPSEVGFLQQSLGLAYSAGGNLVVRERYRIGLELRGSANRIYTPGGADDFAPSFDASLSVGSLFANFSTRPRDGRGVFYGGGIGIGRATVSDDNVSVSDNETQILVAAFVGSDFSRTTFALLRYQGATAEGYRGLSLEFGYRF